MIVATTSYVQLFPAGAWLLRLLDGWRLPLIVGLAGHHGHHSILLVRDA